MMGRMIPYALCLLLLVLPLGAAVPASPLGARIAAFLDASPVEHASFWGIRIVDVEQNRVLYERNANRLFLPASNAKLFTTALALERLGPDYRFQTRVLADRTPGADGCVESLRLVGGGDPNLSGRAIPYNRDAAPGDALAAIEDLASQVAARGVRCVSADIVGDDTAYVWQPYAEGWSVDDAVWDYGAAVSALSINDNTLSVTVLPGGYASDPARMVLTPPVEYYEIDNRVRTARGGERRVMIERLPGVRQLRIWGTLPLADPGDVEVLGIDDPALYAATALRDALMRRGITIRGEARAVHLYPNQIADLKHGPSPEPEPGVEVAVRESAPLVEDLRITDKVEPESARGDGAAGSCPGVPPHRQPRGRDCGGAGLPRRVGHRSRQLYICRRVGAVASGLGNSRRRGPVAGAHVPIQGARCLD